MEATIGPIEAESLVQQPASRPFSLVVPTGLPQGLSAQELLQAERDDSLTEGRSPLP